MMNYLLGIVGILVSIITFAVAYRQTIGARKERIVAANLDLERILVRRVVLESFSPSDSDLNRLREGKSREFRVAESEILSPIQIMNTVYTRVIENDFISTELRKELVGKLRAAPEKVRIPSETEFAHVQRRPFDALFPLLLGVLASFMGAIIAVLPRLHSMTLASRDAFPLKMISAIAAMSFVLILMFLFLQRFRDREDENPPRHPAIVDRLNFEAKVASAVRKVPGAKLSAPESTRYDFHVTFPSGAKVLLDVKSWRGRLPSAFISHVVRRLEDVVDRMGASKAAIVIARPLEQPVELPTSDKVFLLTLGELSGFLQQFR